MEERTRALCLSALSALCLHRANILCSSYREIGIGIAIGAPVDPAWGATYTTDFGAGASMRRANAARDRRTR